MKILQPYCPYCDSKTIATGYVADRCINHPLMVIICDHCTFIGNHGYEFELSKAGTTLNKYNSMNPESVDENDKLYMDGYHYTGLSATVMWECQERLPITPYNFHEYLNRILSLKVFL